jgi:hypothetical protein
MDLMKNESLKANLQVYSRIGGWLVVVVIYIAINCLICAVQLVNVLLTLVQENYLFSMFTTTFQPGNELIPLYYSLYVLGYLFMLAFSVITTIKLLKRKREAKVFAIWFYALSEALVILLYIISKNISSFSGTVSISSFSTSILPAIIWSVYLLKSERVKRTLII